MLLCLFLCLYTVSLLLKNDDEEEELPDPCVTAHSSVANAEIYTDGPLTTATRYSTFGSCTCHRMHYSQSRMPSCEKMQCHRTEPYTASVTSETTHRLQARSFDLQARQSGSPSYLASLISDYAPSRSPRSSDKQLLSRPYTSLVMADKAFSVSAPMISNDRPINCRLASNLCGFKRNANLNLNANSSPAHMLIIQ